MTPYQLVLGDTYERLHEHVRTAHEAPLTATGEMTVRHGTHPLTQLFVRAMKLPAAGVAQPVTLRVTLVVAPSPTRESASVPKMTWTRQIGSTRLDTTQFARRDRLVEQSGAGTVQFSLRVDGDALVYEGSSCKFLRVPVPKSLAPTVRARVAPSSDGWHVAVTVDWRRALICSYSGSMRPIQPTIVR